MAGLDGRARRALGPEAKAARKRADVAIDRTELNKAFAKEWNAAVRVESTGGMSSDSAVAVLRYFKTARREAFKKGASSSFTASMERVSVLRLSLEGIYEGRSITGVWVSEPEVPVVAQRAAQSIHNCGPDLSSPD